jgi:hypothetical protein
MDNFPDMTWVDILPVKDFHAVCGDIEIPWATEKEKREWKIAHASRHKVQRPLTLSVGQNVVIEGGYGSYRDGKIVKIDPPCIYVESNGLYRFNMGGKECFPDGTPHNVTDGWESIAPYEVVKW